jgi:hypothetical protein
MALNKFPGFCRDCNRAVGAGHGDLTRAPSGAWVVTHAATPKAPAKPSEAALLTNAAADLDAEYGNEPDPFDETADEAEIRADEAEVGPAPAGPRTATYHKLPSGAWGIKGPADLRPGETLTVRKRDGSTKRETVDRIVARTTDATVATVVPTASAYPRRRRTYDSPGGIDGRGCGYPGCDGVRFCDDCSE